jgi:hypothetical protein
MKRGSTARFRGKAPVWHETVTAPLRPAPRKTVWPAVTKYGRADWRSQARRVVNAASSCARSPTSFFPNNSSQRAISDEMWPSLRSRSAAAIPGISGVTPSILHRIVSLVAPVRCRLEWKIVGSDLRPFIAESVGSHLRPFMRNQWGHTFDPRSIIPLVAPMRCRLEEV